jgi:cobalt-precorrin-5B (C1)-methyltransferase
MSSWRTGFTTGTCAAAAAKAAAVLLCGGVPPGHVDVSLPDGSTVTLPTAFVRGDTSSAQAAVRKDAGDDPDVTDGCMVTASVEWSDTKLPSYGYRASGRSGRFSETQLGCAVRSRGEASRPADTTSRCPMNATWYDNGDVTFIAGEGVGMVTKPGLSVPPGEPAINPTPRRMIRDAVREVTPRAVRVTISIPGGRELAEKTFNPRLGVEGGLSILGTSGIVRPFSTAALRDALKCALSVATACGVIAPVFVPGRIGEKAAKALFRVTSEQLIEAGNEWGFILDEAVGIQLEQLLVVGHPGKLAKLVGGWWDTHSSRSGSAVPLVMDLAFKLLDRTPEQSPTVEGIFGQFTGLERKTLADGLAKEVRKAIFTRVLERFPIAVALVNMRGELLGQDGDTAAWR